MIDRQALRALDADVADAPIEAMLAVFVKEARDRRKILCEAIDDCDVRVLGYESHALKSSAKTFGLPAVASLAGSLNDQCKSGQLAEALKSAQSLIDCIDVSLSIILDEFNLDKHLATAASVA